MKKVMMTMMTLAVFAAPFATLANDHMMSAHEHKLVGLCKAVMSKSKLRLSVALRKEGLTYAEMQDGLVCNGQDPLTFAKTHGAMDNAYKIASRANMDEPTLVAKN